MQLRELAVPGLDLSEPGTIEFTAERALAGRALNRFALSTAQGWPVTVTPIAVNMVREPLPDPSRLRSLGQAIRASVAAFPGDERVLVIATGGMSHQISGARFGIANEEFDRYFLRQLPGHLDELAAIPVREYMRLGGTEAAELTLWFAMRAALSQRPKRSTRSRRSPR